VAESPETSSIEREIEIASSPETVWESLVKPEKAIHWIGLAAPFDPRSGGFYQVEVIPGHTARGEFVEIDQPCRLVYTFGWDSAGENPVLPRLTLVEFELIPTAAGTTLRFRHRGLPNEQAIWMNERGWNHYLPRLAAVAGGENPGADPWLTTGV